jgi:hypothetical protein
MVRFLFVAVLALPAAVPFGAASTGHRPTATAKRTPPAATLSFHDFFEPTPRELKPSAKLVSLNGKRVRLVGFMAHLDADHDGGEAAVVPGAFYLCPHPTECAEGGAGTGDLPSSAVLVLLPRGWNRTLPFTPRALEVVGRLELGPRTEVNGQVSSLRIFLDPPAARAGGTTRRATSGPTRLRGAKRATWRAPK